MVLACNDSASLFSVCLLLQGSRSKYCHCGILLYCWVFLWVMGLYFFCRSLFLFSLLFFFPFSVSCVHPMFFYYPVRTAAHTSRYDDTMLLSRSLQLFTKKFLFFGSGLYSRLMDSKWYLRSCTDRMVLCRAWVLNVGLGVYRYGTV